MKWFHHKCKNISDKRYNEIVEKKLYFICDDHKNSCYSTILPFNNIEQIELITTFMGDGLYRCKKCKKDCIGHGLMNCIQCDVCDKWLHAKCAALKYTFDSYVNNSSLEFICGDKCERSYLSSLLPFHSIFYSGRIEEFHPHRDNYQCKVCRIECLGFGIHDCIQCDVCMRWLHLNCTRLSRDEFIALSDNDSLFICCKRCEMCTLPFNSIDMMSLDDQAAIPSNYDSSPAIASDVIVYHSPISDDSGELVMDDGDVVINDDSQRITSNAHNIPYSPPTFSNVPVDHSIVNVGTPTDNQDIAANLSSNAKKWDQIKASKSVYFDKFLDIKCSYLSPNEFDDRHLARYKKSEFTVFHNNIRSINANFEEVETDLFNNCMNFPDVMAFSDTQLEDDLSAPVLNGYTFKGAAAPTKGPGGVGIYISNSLEYSVCSDISLDLKKCEEIWVKLTLNSNSKFNQELIIGVVYRHDFNANYDNFCQRFCDILMSLNKKKKKYFIVGDFNINLMKYNLASNVTKYMNAISSTGCNMFIDKPTRYSSKTCLDHVYSNLPTENLDNHILLSDTTDHYPTLTKISGISRNVEKEEIFIRKSNLNDSEWESLNAELEQSLKINIPFQHLLNSEHLASAITNTYQSVLDKFMPLKKITKKQQKHDKPWITSGIKASIKRKYQLLDVWKKTNSTVDKQKLNTFHIKLTRIKEKSRLMYYREKSILYGQDKAKTWQLINEISNRKRKKGASIKSIKTKKGNILSDSTSISNCFNDHFATVGKNMSKKFSDLDPSKLKDPLSFISKKMVNSIILSDTNCNEISRLLSQLNSKTSSAYDLVSNKTLKATKEVICPYLEVLFNKCLNEGVFPAAFKTAEVIPLYKGGDKMDLNNFRPISLLPAIGKLFEKLLAIRVIKFFNKHELFTSEQFGFRAKFATDFAIADIYDKLIYNLDNELSSCAIFLDLAKAFDSVDHEILLKKMECYGFRGKTLELFRSYLKSRSQYVKLNGIKSSLLEIEFGVPQGSILGPLLFLIFINDLPNATNLYIKLFADDTFLCAQNTNFADLENEVNTELEKVSIWLASNKLTLNTDKSKYMLVSNKRDSITNMHVTVNDAVLKSCDSYKYLGVYFDKNLDWSPHIQYISKKISKACGALAKLRHCVSLDIRKNVYHALVYSYLRYGIVAWGGASQSVLEPLQILTNKIIRIMDFLPPGNIDLISAYRELKLLQIKKIHELEVGKLIFKEKNGLMPTEIANYFEIDSNVRPHCHFVRHERAPRFICRSKIGEKSLQFAGMHLWNSIPSEIKTSESYNIFKKSYKKHLIDH